MTVGDKTEQNILFLHSEFELFQLPATNSLVLVSHTVKFWRFGMLSSQEVGSWECGWWSWSLWRFWAVFWSWSKCEFKDYSSFLPYKHVWPLTNYFSLCIKPYLQKHRDQFLSPLYSLGQCLIPFQCETC